MQTILTVFHNNQSGLLSCRSDGSVSLAELEDWDVTELARIPADIFGMVHLFHVHGPAVYIQDGYQRRVHLINVSIPEQPVYAGIIPELAGPNGAAAISGDTMIVFVNGELKVFDLSDPLEHQFLMAAPLNTSFSQMGTNGELLYGLSTNGQLYTYDIRNLPESELVCVYDGVGKYLAISPDGRFLTTEAIYTWYDGPYEFGHTQTQLFALDWTGDRPYLLKRWTGTSWGDAIKVLHTQLSTSLHYAAYDEGYEYMGGAVRATDISDPHNPQAVGQDSDVTGLRLALDWPYLYAIEGEEFVVYGLEETAVPELNPFSVTFPSQCTISSIYPNPFNPETTITIDMPEEGTAKLTVYDILGREAVTIANQRFGAGRHALTFDASDLPSGLYFARLDVDKFTSTRKMVLLK